MGDGSVCSRFPSVPILFSTRSDVREGFFCAGSLMRALLPGKRSVFLWARVFSSLTVLFFLGSALEWDRVKEVVLILDWGWVSAAFIRYVSQQTGVSGIDECSWPPALAQQRSSAPDPVRPHARQQCNPMTIGLHVGSLSASPGAALECGAPSLPAGHNGVDAYRQ
jgi:hypothetical protein